MSRPHSVNRKTLSASLLLLAVLLQPIPASAQLVSGINAERLARIDGVLQSYVDNGELVGAVALVLHNGETVYEKAVGFSDREAGQPMTTANLFRIASQTKALTSVVILSLMEEGKLNLNDPVSRFIPEWAATTVAEVTEAGMKIVPARRQITLRDLLTHTAGISYGTQAHIADLYAQKGLGPEAGMGWYTADK